MLHALKKFRSRTAQSSLNRRASSSIFPIATAGFALILAGCGGSSGDGTAAVVPGNNTLVSSGQFAGLDQECVDMLVGLDANVPLGIVQLSCRPENIETDSSTPVADLPIEDATLEGTTSAGTDSESTNSESTNSESTNSEGTNSEGTSSEGTDSGDMDSEGTLTGGTIAADPITTPATTPALNTAPADVAGGNFYQGSRVSALLNGPAFGTGTRPNSELVKPLAVQIENDPTDLKLIELRALRDSNGDNTTDYLGVVQNTGSDFLCSITLRDLTEFSPTGQPIVNEDDLDFALLEGEIGTDILDNPADPFYFASCLPPGSLGYISSLRDTLFDEVAELRVQSLTSSSNRVQFDASMLPLSYRVEIDGSVTITIVNNHSEPLDVFSVDAIAIDEQGQAFSFDFELPLTVVAPGAELEVTGFFPRFAGRASTIRAIIDFEKP